MRLLVLLLSACLSLPSMAHMNIKQESSSVSFISVKKEHIVENHQFNLFRGAISKKGEVLLSIDLTSVDTNIGIRDQRIKEFLFETEIFPKAEFKTQLPVGTLKNLSVGDSTLLEVEGTVSLHGIEKSETVSVMVSKLAEGKLVVASTKALLIKAKDYNLSSGILKLKDLAGLSSIGETVPVNFVLTFEHTEG